MTSPEFIARMKRDIPLIKNDIAQNKFEILKLNPENLNVTCNLELVEDLLDYIDHLTNDKN